MTIERTAEDRQRFSEDIQRIADARDRETVSTPNYIVSWWSKDGYWHVALPRPDVVGLFWTDSLFHSKDEALAFTKGAEDV